MKPQLIYIVKQGLLTVLGIIFGALVGKLLHYIVIQIVVPNEAMLDPVLTLKSYFVSNFYNVICEFSHNVDFPQ